MKKRLIFAALAILLLSTFVLSGCSTLETDTASNADLVDTTGYACIKVYGIKDASTTDEAIEKVENAINKIMLKENKTMVKLMLFTEDKYDEGIKEARDGLDKIAAEQKEKKAETRAETKRLAKLKSEDYEAYRKEMLAKQKADREKAAEKERIEKEKQAQAEAAGEEYIPDIEVPEASIDVIFIKDTDTLKEYKKESLLKALSEYVSLDYKSIAKYIHPTLLNAGKVGSTLYGIVNNATYEGNSQYAVIDAEMYEKYGSKIAGITGLSSFKSFLDEIKTNEEDVIPLKNLPEFAPGADYLVDRNYPIGAYNPDNNTETDLTIMNLYQSNNFNLYYNAVSTFRKNGYIREASDSDDSAKYAMMFVTGDEYKKSELEEEGYVVLTFSAPRITDETCKLSFYGVYAESSYPTRAMNFIELITTNPELQTIFAYGIEGENFELVNGQVKKLNDTYSRDLSTVGNRLIGYTTVDEKPDLFEKVRERNKNVVLSSLYGYKFNYDSAYLQEYTCEKVESNLQFAANSVSGEKFKYFVNGRYEPDEFSAAYDEELRSTCLNYEVSGGFFMTTPYKEEIDGFYSGCTSRSKLEGVTNVMNEKVSSDDLPETFVKLMKEAGASTEAKAFTELVPNENDPTESILYAVYPIFYDDGNSAPVCVGLICSYSHLEDTMPKLHSILAEYYDDIVSGIPTTSVIRYAESILDSISEGLSNVERAKESVKEAETAEEKASAKRKLDSLPDTKSIIASALIGMNEDESIVKGYADKVYGYYQRYHSGQLKKDGFCQAVRDLIYDDFLNYWSIGDEIDNMSARFNNETNMGSLIDILNNQLK